MDPSSHRPETQAIPERGARVVVATIAALIIGALLAGSAVFLWQQARLLSLQGDLDDANKAAQGAAAQVTGLKQQITDLQEQLSQENKAATREDRAARDATRDARTAEDADNGTGDLIDAKWFGRLGSVTMRPDELEVDVQQFFTGTEAKQAARRDGTKLEGDSYIRNENTDLRTLTVAAGAAVDVLQQDGASSKHTTISYADFVKQFEATKSLRTHGYWLWVEGGQVTKIEEQFHP